MTMELARGSLDEREEAQGRWGLADLAPIGRLGIVLLLAGWSWFLLEPLMSSAVGGQLLGVLGRLAQSALITGAALTVMGYLLAQSPGFQRAAGARAFEPERVVDPPVAHRPQQTINAAPPPAPAQTPPGTMVVVARGQVDDRGFLVLADGSVVIETLLGQRRFRTIVDARDFIGGGKFVLHDTVQIVLKAPGFDTGKQERVSVERRIVRHV